MEARNLGSFLFLYRKFAKTETKSDRTIETVTTAVTLFDRFLDGCEDVSKVTAEDLRRFIRELQSRQKWNNHPTIKNDHGGLSPFTIANYVRHIRAFWSWLHREGLIENNPFEGVKPPQVPHNIVNTFIPEQVKQLLAVIPRDSHKGFRDYSIVVTLYGVGPRISEVINLKSENVNFDTGQFKVLGKGARERILFMPPSVYKSMFKYYQRWRPKVASEYFFVTDDGKQLSRFNFEHRIHNYGQKAGIAAVQCRPHVLRHSFAIEFLRGGGDIFSLQKILGHATPEMTRHYARLADRDVEVKLRTFSPVEKLRLRV